MSTEHPRSLANFKVAATAKTAFRAMTDTQMKEAAAGDQSMIAAVDFAAVLQARQQLGPPQA